MAMRGGHQRGVLALCGQRTLGRGAAAKQPTHARVGERAARNRAGLRGAPAGWGRGLFLPTPNLQARLSRAEAEGPLHPQPPLGACSLAEPPGRRVWSSASSSARWPRRPQPLERAARWAGAPSVQAQVLGRAVGRSWREQPRGLPSRLLSTLGLLPAFLPSWATRRVSSICEEGASGRPLSSCRIGTGTRQKPRPQGPGPSQRAHAHFSTGPGLGCRGDDRHT